MANTIPGGISGLTQRTHIGQRCFSAQHKSPATECSHPLPTSLGEYPYPVRSRKAKLQQEHRHDWGLTVWTGPWEYLLMENAWQT
eukprot:scaffold3319_cov427-Prasinococcus_capsulatus_cf.AAC.23